MPSIALKLASLRSILTTIIDMLAKRGQGFGGHHMTKKLSIDDTTVPSLSLSSSFTSSTAHASFIAASGLSVFHTLLD